MSSDSDVPLIARASAVKTEPSRPAAAASPQRAAAAGKSYIDSSDDETPLSCRGQAKSHVKTEYADVKPEAMVKEPQSAAQAAPGSVAREAAVKQAAAEILHDECRDAARQAAKKQAAVKNSGKPSQPDKSTNLGSKANGKANPGPKPNGQANPGSKPNGKAKVKQEPSKIVQKTKTVAATQSGKQNGKDASKVVRERKTYELPFQKKETPEALDPLRIFYISTREQMASLKDSKGKPRHSEMSERWLLERGLIPKEEIPQVAKRWDLDTKKMAVSPSKAPKRKSPGTNNGRTAIPVSKPAPKSRVSKEVTKSKGPPIQKPAPKAAAPKATAMKKPMPSSTERAAVEKRMKAEAQLAAMGSSSDDDDDIPFAKRMKA